MKKSIIVVTILYLSMMSTFSINAQTKTASPSAQVSATPSTDVDVLKEKVAKTVTRTKGITEKAKSGHVSEVDDTSLTMVDESGVKNTADLDATLTQYFEVQGSIIKTIKKDAIKKDDYVFVYGPEISGAVQANAVYKDVRYVLFSGTIAEIDKANFTIKMVTLDKINITLDVQTRTTQEMIDIKTLEVNKTGFSKLKEGDALHAVVKAPVNPDNKNRYDAEKLLVLPNEYFLQ